MLPQNIKIEQELHNIKNQGVSQILDIVNLDEIERLKVQYLGRKGRLNKVSEEMKTLEPGNRAVIGRLFNDVKTSIEKNLEEKSLEIKKAKKTGNLIDPTEPGIKPEIGHTHLISQSIKEISSIFEKIGFVRVRYPEVEWDWYAFESLNMQKNHPARDEWETFFVDNPPHPTLGQMVLTPHTSSGQVREMQRTKPPIRMINIAKTYRRQSDVTHVPMFHQFEGLVIDKEINITHLKGTIDYFAKNYYGASTQHGPKAVSRIRPFHFRFTEPSFEVDFSCVHCNGQGCRFCKSGWHEVGGAGMVHPSVLRAGGIDPKIYTGFAFGWGVERTTLLKPGIGVDDVRTLYSTDLRFLKQF